MVWCVDCEQEEIGGCPWEAVLYDAGYERRAMYAKRGETAWWEPWARSPFPDKPPTSIQGKR